MDKSVDNVWVNGGGRDLTGLTMFQRGNRKTRGQEQEVVHSFPQFIHRLFHKDWAVLQTEMDRKLNLEEGGVLQICTMPTKATAVFK